MLGEGSAVPAEAEGLEGWIVERGRGGGPGACGALGPSQGQGHQDTQSRRRGNQVR